jgi:hypothetical protein
MSCQPSPAPRRDRVIARRATFACIRIGLCSLAAVVATGAVAAVPKELAGSGVATVPADAAFFSSALRIEEQVQRFVGSNAFARLKELPVLKRALDSWQEQEEMPGSPVSMFLTFLELPENEQAVALLADMVATDTFLYGEPSCIAFVKLIKLLQRAQQTAQMLGGAGGDAILELEELEMIEEDEDVEAALGGPRILPVGRQVELDLDVPIGAGQSQAVLAALAENLDLVVVPDLVWGFKTTKQEAGEFQIKRLEVLAKMLVETVPDLAGSLARRTLPGGEVVTFTLDAGLLPWSEIAEDIADEVGDSEQLDRVIDHIQDLDVVVALGVLDDWVVLSVGGSADHLEKLVLPGSKGRSLLETDPFKPLREDAARPLTAISYMSKPLAEAVAASPEDLDPLARGLAAQVASGAVPPDAGAEGLALLEEIREEYGRRLSEPGGWMAYSFVTETGFEGYAWDWSQNTPFDGGERLSLVDHVGGSPAAVAITRFRSDPDLLGVLAGLARGGWALAEEHARPTMADDEGERFDAFKEKIAPLGGRLVEILADKIGAALADGQVGMVIDAKATTTKPQQALPASAEPLPILEPAIVLPLADRKLFVEGLNDLFVLGDDLVDRIREIDPDAVPPAYEIPEPEREKVAGGSVWTFAIPDAGLDEQVKPTIAVGDQAVVFSLVPSQAARMLTAKPLETGARLADIGQPLAGLAAADVPALVDTIEPWVVYLTRYGSVQQREGWVDDELELSADDETEEASEALEHVSVVFEVARCLRGAAVEATARDGATVSHWRNEIRDLPPR